MSFLEVRNLTVAYGAIQAVRGVTFSVEKGQIVSLIGSNGAGKTTTLRAISGLLPRVSGEILLDGEPLHRLPAHEILARGVAHSPEGRRLFARMTVEENLRLGLVGRRSRDGAEEDLAEVAGVFPVVREFADRQAGVLSGGQQQMLVIARALVARPDVLLLDEPSLGLSPLLVDQILDAIVSLRRDGMTVLLVEQNASAALAIADRGYVLETGRVAASGTGSELLGDPQVRAAYLGVE